jgi:DNA-binding transcriptional ArsR family regulator
MGRTRLPISGSLLCTLASTHAKVEEKPALLIRVRILVSVPLYQAKAEMFRVLGHPVRIRVLELLQAGPQPVRDLLADIDVEASSLSQQLAVLRRAGVVVSFRDGGLVMYALSTPAVADLLAAGRRILREVLTDRDGLLAQLQSAAPED